ncbi:MAG TPA: hypothetical protein VG847_12025 [Chitinophagaceae bacterium]|nr:hypothetical protein [Chitinophagaceae bacterium]
MLFKEVIGQEKIKQKLAEMVQHNRLSHALLFLGKEGSGGLPLALAFAQYIACTSAKQSSSPQQGLFGENTTIKKNNDATDACGHCASCIKAGQLIHPDIHFSFPVIPKKAGSPPVSDDYINEWREFIAANPYGNVYDWLQFLGAENKQGNITAEECNQINHKLSLKSFESEYKIMIMWMPEFLGSSGNKLLKLIEEPPDDTIFIFVAEDESQVLPTILSRTQLIKIPACSNDEIENGLIHFADTPAGKASQIAGISDGNYREALRLLKDAEQDWEALIREWLNIIVKNNNAAQVKWIDEISQLGREKQKQLLRYFIHLLSQSLRWQLVSNPESILMPENKRDFARRINKMCPAGAQEAMINDLNDAIFYIERNAHAKMLFHALTIRLYHIIKDNSLILMD